MSVAVWKPTPTWRGSHPSRRQVGERRYQWFIILRHKHNQRYREDHSRQPDRILVPLGAPTWVTAQLISETIEAWQEDYDHELTADDALEILLLFDQLFGVLEEPDAG